MATPQLSPGVLVREVDLTVGRAGEIAQELGGNYTRCSPTYLVW